ncbi:MAG TPA: Ldh family oxidoreductase [Symbiobacteriaceae bacterium]
MTEPAAKTLLIAPDRLFGWCRQLLMAAGVPTGDAEEIARHLLFADLRGVSTHGTSRLKIYLTRMAAGLVDPNPQIRVLRETPVSAWLDGGNGFGQVVARRATDLAIEKARAAGVAVVGVKNSTHCGCMAYYTMRMAEAGLIGMAATNAPAVMPPYGGKEAFFGTNPFSVAAPAGDGQIFVFDMATSQVSRGKIIEAAREGRPIPEGWATDKDGHPTTDAKAALEGFLLPLGGPKGYLLAFMVELFSGILTGARIGPDLPRMYESMGEPQQVGHFFWAFRPDLFLPMEEFTQRMAQTMERVRNVAPAPGFERVLAPGDLELAKEAKNRSQGIPIPPGMYREFCELASRYGVPFPVAPTTPEVIAHADQQGETGSQER